MDDSTFFQDKSGRILEDIFFSKQDKILIDKLHQIEKMKETKKVLAQVSGITNDDILQKLVDLNIRPEIVASLALVPLVEVAWADGKVDEKEKTAVLEAAGHSFVSKDSPDFDLLKRWMERKPDATLLEAWEHYMKGLCEKLTPHQKNALKKDLLGHARQVAEAAGGILGLGGKMSKSEQEILAKLESPFN
jgi:uncharacterized tellurite resistance protein B-like protein